jgi:hypothetical protein
MVFATSYGSSSVFLECIQESMNGLEWHVVVFVFMILCAIRQSKRFKSVKYAHFVHVHVFDSWIIFNFEFCLEHRIDLHKWKQHGRSDYAISKLPNGLQANKLVLFTHAHDSHTVSYAT